YREHSEVTALLTPPDEADASTTLPEHLSTLDAKGRVVRIGEAMTRNLDRLGRLSGLFKDEVAALEASAQSAAAQADPQAQDPQAQAQELEAAKELYARA